MHEKRFAILIGVLLLFIGVNLLVLTIPEWSAGRARKRLSAGATPEEIERWGQGVSKSAGALASGEGFPALPERAAGRTDEGETTPGEEAAPDAAETAVMVKAPDAMSEWTGPARTREDVDRFFGTRGLRLPEDTIPAGGALDLERYKRTPLVSGLHEYARMWVDEARNEPATHHGKKVRIFGRFFSAAPSSSWLSLERSADFRATEYLCFATESDDFPRHFVPVGNASLLLKLAALSRGEWIQVFGGFIATDKGFVIVVDDILPF